MKIRNLVIAAGIAASSVVLAAPAGADTYSPSPGCATAGSSSLACAEVAVVVVDRNLAQTGVETATMVGAGAMLVAGGAVLVATSRRRSQRAATVRV